MIGPNGGREATGRVVLLGGKALAVRCLERMLRMPDVDVVAVVPCAGDDPDAERWYPSLARYARERGLPVHQPRSANEEGFLAVLEDLCPDLLFSIFYDKILKPHVLRVPTMAAVNLHFGLLPYNRGSFPIPWAIIDGNDPGVTLHHMDPGVDTGDIIAQLAVPVADHETALEVYERCTEAGVYLLERHLPLLLAGRAPRRRQPAEGGTYYRPGYPFDRWIDWSQSAGSLCRFVRALSFPPFPSARTMVRGRELEVCHPAWLAHKDGRGLPGTILDITRHWATIAAGEEALAVRTMRLDGEELPAAEALMRVGCTVGEMLESVSWMKREVA